MAKRCKYVDNKVTWWENMDGVGTSWTEHVPDANFTEAYAVYLATPHPRVRTNFA
jgi:hypothetical protein